jgi:citrate lyase subunit beta/citryl-CoA lyase
MLVLNPKEIPLVHQYFTPNDDEVNRAKEIIKLYNESIIDGRGVAIIDKKFIGPPMVLLARNVLNAYERAMKRKG